MLALRYGRLLTVLDGMEVRYVVELIPIEVAINSLVTARGARADVYGAGINPVGLTLTATCGRIRTFLGMSGGLIALLNAMVLYTGFSVFR